MFALAVLALSIVQAGPDSQGVSDDAVLIGMEGPAQSFSVDEENLGMRLVIKEVNDRGGVHGRQLVERSYPRGTEGVIEQQIENVTKLDVYDRVFALFNFGGPGSVAVGEYAMAHGLPHLFPHTALLTLDGARHIFTSYPRYDGESRVMLRYLAKERGVRTVAVIHADNVYGRYFVDRARELQSEMGYRFVGHRAIPRRPEDVSHEMRALAQMRPDALVMALYPAQARRVVEAKRALSWSDVRLVSSGPLTDEQYLDIEGGAAYGTLGFCHYPDPNESEAPGVVTYRKLMRKHFPGRELNRYSLYGYVFGKIVVEGLERAGRELTRVRFLDAMESIRDWDSGGILPAVSFSAEDHHAQSAGFICELVDGRFEARSGWTAPN